MSPDSISQRNHRPGCPVAPGTGDETGRRTMPAATPASSPGSESADAPPAGWPRKHGPMADTQRA
jgi:hypothetical protein